jgi:hypothetical protein
MVAWTLDLERAGILSENMMFSEREKQSVEESDLNNALD